MNHYFRLFFLDHSIFCQLSQHNIWNMFRQRQLLSTDFFFKCFALFFWWLSSTCTRRNHIKMHHCAVQCSGCWLVCSTVILLAVTCCCKNPIASQSAQPFLETLKGRKGGAEKNLPPLYTYYVFWKCLFWGLFTLSLPAFLPVK